MTRVFFLTEAGVRIPAIDEAEMREIDRIAVDDFQLGILQMMENAGRNLATHAMRFIEDPSARITVLAGSGGNGGGGLCCARHLHNRGFAIDIILSKDPDSLRGAARSQMSILLAAGILPVELSQAEDTLARSDFIIDTLIGYSLSGPPTGTVKELIDLANAAPAPVLSLDLPSGFHATSGMTPGTHIQAVRTMTLAAPKTGLLNYAGALYLADIGIPPKAFQRIGVELPPFPPGVFIQRLYPS